MNRQGFLFGWTAAALALFLVLQVLALDAVGKAERRTVVDTLLSTLRGTAALLERWQPPSTAPTPLPGAFRLSLFAGDGTRVYDSALAASQVETAPLPEVDDARASGQGWAVRPTAPDRQETLFFARKTDAGLVLRLSAPLPPPSSALLAAFGALDAVFVALVGGWALRRSRRLTRDLADLAGSATAFAAGQPSPLRLVDRPADLRRLSLALSRLFDRVNHRVAAELKRSDELAAVLEGMVEAVVVVDTSLIVRTMNPAARRLFPTPQEPKGLSLIEVCRHSALDALAVELVRGTQTNRSEIVLQDHETTLQVQGAPLLSQGSPWGAVLVMSDISQLKRLEAMRRDFVANVSHELKTPITNIKGYVETLEAGAVDAPERARPFLEIIGRHADRLAAIVDDLLILTRLENSPPEPGERRTVDLGEALHSVVALSQPKAKARKVKLEVVYDGKPKQLLAYPVLLEQALANLVDNAVKFSPERGVVRLAVRLLDNAVELEIRDQGPGIPEGEQQRVFERFYRTEQGRSTEGTGLGLSIVKHIALVHRGSVALASPPAGQTRGTAIALRLPRD